MTKEDLNNLKEKISQLDELEKKQRNIYLKKLATGELQGPPTGYATIDKPWLKNYSDELINSDLPQDTIYGYLRKKNRDRLDRTALEYFGNKVTYRQLLEKIDVVSKSLWQLGVRKGDIVTVCMPTTPEMVYIFYALSKIGAISNMIDPRKSTKEMEEYTNEVNSKLFIGVDLVQDKIKDIKLNTKVENVVVITPYESFKKPIKKVIKLAKKVKINREFLSWDEFIQVGSNVKEIEENKYKPNKTVTIVHTGGTTGKSKGVKLSDDNINMCAYQCEYSGLDFKDISKDNPGTWFDIMPPFIVYGVGNGLHLPLTMGKKVILIPKFNPEEYDKMLLKHKPNYMAGVPSHYNYLLNSKKLKDIDLSFIKTPIVGGDKMDYTLEEEVNKFLKSHNCASKIIKGYGMSEVDAAVSVCINNDVNKFKSVGIPLSHTTIGIFDYVTGDELPYDEYGEVRISGPNVMVGYYQNDEEEKKVLHEEKGERVIYSSDRGKMDKDGTLFVTGRYKDMIVRHDGFKVYPSEIENIILTHPAVSECKIVGVRNYDESQGELPIAYIILKDDKYDKEKIISEIRNICQKELAEYSIPIYYNIINSFPKTSIGKIDTNALKKESDIKIRKLKK